MADPTAKATVWSETPTRRYLTTPASFIKVAIPPSNMDEWNKAPLNEARLLNERAALDFISTHTTIPVPKVLSSGRNKDGQVYLETEWIDGTSCDNAENQCRMPAGQKHNDGGICYTCGEIAMSNVARFIENQVLPQLNSLRSTTAGFQGNIIPPPLVLEDDKRLEWVSKGTEKRDRVFCHGDLIYHNVLVHRKTLQPVALID
ncbi:hypothetical protein BU26DRAFT_177774 [Trematosphaeria pertusa]|uniref:Uncharacterized protein n=1 Tax=Trematosphaeria pertusa TaxID=390896 RepID=A0A6A6HUI1_9PLEO|nr:uncharacterized protein BU26DRAFT_177774 [Trematosphaeria pertusa]KAF2241418.1 hypothetical protein BU26DRAFT_177774 [Trematosphaeria pertusa]